MDVGRGRERGGDVLQPRRLCRHNALGISVTTDQRPRGAEEPEASRVGSWRLGAAEITTEQQFFGEVVTHGEAACRTPPVVQRGSRCLLGSLSRACGLDPAVAADPAPVGWHHGCGLTPAGGRFDGILPGSRRAGIETVTGRIRPFVARRVVARQSPLDGRGHRARLTFAVLSSKPVAIAEKLAGELIRDT